MSVSHDSSGLMWDLSDFGNKNIIMILLSIYLSLLLHAPLILSSKSRKTPQINITTSYFLRRVRDAKSLQSNVRCFSM